MAPPWASRRGQVPGVAHHDTTGPCGPDGFFPQGPGQRHRRPARLMPCPTVGSLAHARIPLLRQARPRLWRRRARDVGNMGGPRGCPRGPLRSAARQAQAPRETHRATARAARDGVMGQGGGAVAGVVVAVHLVQETPHVCAQGISTHDQRFAAAMPMGCRLLAHGPEAAAMDRRLTPGGF
jgi:hypothetical protein